MANQPDRDRLLRAVEDAAELLRSSLGAGNGRFPGAAIGVATTAGLHRSTVMGVADATTSRPVEATTPFCLASTTKPIAGALLCAAVDAGTIGLDDLIADHLGAVRLPPGLVPWREATVREVATHTAGLGTHARFFYADEGEPIAVADAVATLARPVVEPGTRWNYSNLGYGVLETALATAFGCSFAEAVERFLFRPLGMAASSVGGWTGPEGAAVRHSPDGLPYAPYVTDHQAASEGWCSIDDLLAFGLAAVHGTLLSPSAHALSLRPQVPRRPDGGAYALGWVQREFGPEHTAVLLHAGSMGGVAAHLAIVPSIGLVVAALANAETGVVSDALTSVLGATIPGYHRPIEAPAAPFGPPSASVAGRWRGTLLVDGDETLPFELHVPVDADIEATLGSECVRLVAPRCTTTSITAYAPFRTEVRWAPPGAVFELDLTCCGDLAHGGATAHHYDPGTTRMRGAVSYPVLLER